MKLLIARRLIAVVTLVIASIGAAGAQSTALKIVVIAGEGAANIIQQKTAVRPLIEVRDRNNVPVAGASVTFTIGGGGQGAAFAGGAQTLTVTTNAAGQAAASGLNAVSSGAFQIQVQAAYQGQVATAAISQTNFATAAAASQAGAGAGGGGTAGATGGAAGGGGGLSATTIGIVGAAVGGGALVVKQTVLKQSDEEQTASKPSGQETFDSYNGTMSGQLALLAVATNPQGQSSSCTRSHVVSGPIRIDLRPGNSAGRASAQFTMPEVAVTGNCGPVAQPITFTFNKEDTAVSGGPSALTFRGVAQLTSVSYAVTFTGALSGNIINGTLRIDVTSQPPFDSSRPNYTGSTTLPVALTK